MAAKKQSEVLEQELFGKEDAADGRGRPKRVIDEHVIISLSAYDFNVSEICGILKLSTATLYEKFPKEKLHDLIRQGRERGTSQLKARAFQLANAGDASLLRFLIRKRDPEYASVMNVKGKVDHDHQHTVRVVHDRATLEEKIRRLQPVVQRLLAQGAAPAPAHTVLTPEGKEVKTHGRATRRKSRTAR